MSHLPLANYSSATKKKKRIKELSLRSDSLLRVGVDKRRALGSSHNGDKRMKEKKIFA